ncbi:MAG: nuclear transport factor 2 family protein [Caldilineaceae bacterium]
MNNARSMSDAASEATLATIQRFNAAVNTHDVDAVMALMTPDAVFENTYPPPDGERFVGAAAVRGFWADFFGASPNAAFTTEEIVACGERAFVRWWYHWTDAQGNRGHIRGVDIFRVRDGKVAEKLAYVKG